jgi:HD-GYP domain-containing protein (c-di-GMP phosphodiesterase class II)
VRIADAFDAMTHRRPYSSPRTVEDALEELARCAGRQFDPELVSLMEAVVRRGGTTDIRVLEARQGRSSRSRVA